MVHDRRRKEDKNIYQHQPDVLCQYAVASVNNIAVAGLVENVCVIH